MSPNLTEVSGHNCSHEKQDVSFYTKESHGVKTEQQSGRVFIRRERWDATQCDKCKQYSVEDTTIEKVFLDILCIEEL